MKWPYIQQQKKAPLSSEAAPFHFDLDPVQVQSGQLICQFYVRISASVGVPLETSTKST